MFKQLLTSVLALATAAAAQAYTTVNPPVQQVHVVKTQQTVQDGPTVVICQQPQYSSVVTMPGKSSPIGLGIFPQAQFPAVTDDVSGIRLSLFVSENTHVGVFDFATLAAITDQNFLGFGLSGLWNHVGQNAQGVMLAGLGNSVNANFSGIQIATFINNNDQTFDTQGLQIALINKSGNNEGIQIGLMNQANLMTGIQIGGVNVTEYISGIQIGAVNIIRKSQIPCMIVFNMAF